MKYCPPIGKIFFFLLLVVALFGSSCNSRSQITHLGASREPHTMEQQYQAAQQAADQLAQDTHRAANRQNWLAAIRMFRKVYIADPKSKYAAACLYGMADLYQRLYHHFHQLQDLEEALSYYKDTASLFPKTSWAAKAIWQEATIWETEKKDPQQAAVCYLHLVKNYPETRFARQARQRLQTLQQKNRMQLPANLAGKHPISKKLVRVLPVKYWSSDEYTRVVIRAEAPVRYTSSLLEKMDDQPRRLYIDFSGSFIPKKFRQPIPIQDGLLKRVRTGQFNESTVRVVLDIESISDYKIFSLNDPFRVVVDVHGAKNQAHPASPQPPSSRPKANNNKASTATRAMSAAVKKPSPGGETENFITLDDEKKIKPAPHHQQRAAKNGHTASSSLSLAQQLGLHVRRIVIDPGHGGKDPGAIAYGLKEKNIVLQVAKKVGEILRKNYNYDVLLTRDKDVFIPLEERTAIANTHKADLFVSIHVNAHPSRKAHGVETFYLNLATNTEAMRVAARENATSTHNISELQDILSDLMQNSKIKESSHLAEYVQTHLITGLAENKFRVKDLGVRQAPFYVLIGAEMPAILAEIAFITNPREAKLLKSQTYLNTIAEQIATGVAAYVDYRNTAALKL